MPSKVAILIVTHNAEQYITRTLRSCLEQTYTNFEIVILDNASSDSTVEIMRDFHSPKIKIYTSPSNIGPYAGINYLLERVENKYVAIQDHDDIWFPNKVEKQVEFLESQKEYVACGTQAYYYFEDRKTIILMNNYNITGYVDHTSLMFRNSQLRYDLSRSLPDEYFQAATLRTRGLIGCLPIGLTVHRIRSDKKNLSSTRSRLNIKGAWEHLRNTKYRDISGMLAIIFSAVLPQRIIWWSRKHFSFKHAEWMTVEKFEDKFGLKL